MPTPNIKKVPKLYTRASIVPKTFDAENRTVEITWSTGHKGLRSGYWSDPYFEQLSMDPKHVRMDFLQSGRAPFLDVHNQWRSSDVFGVIEKAWLKDGNGYALIRLSRRKEVVDGAAIDIEDGVLSNVSVGYRVHQYEKQPEAEGEKYRTYLAVDWEPVEVSIVPIGFDPYATTRTRDGDDETECVFINSIATRGGEEEASMPPEIETTPAANVNPTPAPAVDTEQVRKAAVESERQRVLDIRHAVRTAKLEDAFADKLISDGITIDQARALVIDEVGKKDSANHIRSQHQVTAGGQDEIETRRAGIESAILHRFDQKKYPLAEQGRSFAHMSLHRIAEELVGRKGLGMSRSEIAQRALSSSDFPIILGSIVRRTLLDGYQVQPQTFRPIVRQGTLPDYREMSRVQFGAALNLEKVREHGEYTEGYFGEGAEKIRVAKYGKVINITEETIVNDDMDAISRTPSIMGSAASRLESKLVWDIFLLNPKMSDNKALFHADHKNLAGSGLAIGETGLNAMRVAIRTQKTPDGNDTLDLVPAYLIVGPDKETEAKKILATNLVAAKSTDVNVFANSLDLIVESRITGNQWFGACSPNQIDTVEIAYLEGMNGPQISTKEKFESDGVSIKIKHVVGVKAIDFRGLYKNPGA